jgi:hypothetical protein
MRLRLLGDGQDGPALVKRRAGVLIECGERLFQAQDGAGRFVNDPRYIGHGYAERGERFRSGGVRLI